MKISSTFLVLVVGSAIEAIAASRVTIINNCHPVKIWPAAWGRPTLPTTGFELSVGESKTIEMPRPWNGRFWARTNCKQENGQFKCKTGDCGEKDGPECKSERSTRDATLIDLNLGSNGAQDFYHISNVYGSNFPVQVTPSGGSGEDCQKISCTQNINSDCPEELQIKEEQWVVGCRSPCDVHKDDKLCCNGDQYNTPEKCTPSDILVKKFKQKCPQVESYRHDYESNLFACSGDTNYEIKFCP